MISKTSPTKTRGENTYRRINKILGILIDSKIFDQGSGSRHRIVCAFSVITVCAQQEEKKLHDP